jgi:predicted MFS family arabinose efflux permease
VKFALGRRSSFWVAAAVVAAMLWTSGAPSVTYPLYAQEWNLSPAVTTAIFAVYPAVLVIVLIFSGDLSDHIGRRIPILLGLSASLAGSLLFAVAGDVAWVFAGRVLMGVGVGLSMSPATAAMVEFSAAGRTARASSIATAATAVGLAMATLVGGGLIQYAPFPTHLNFWVLSAVVTAVLGAAWFLPRSARGSVDGRWRPRVPYIPPRLRLVFLTSALAVSTAFACGAIFLSLGADIARDLVGSTNALVNGSTLAVTAIVIGGTALLAKGIPWRRAIILGGVSAAVGMGLLLLAAEWESLTVVLICAVVAGAGYSLLFLGGLTLVSAAAPPHHRAGMLSAVYLVAYLLQGLTAIGLGLLATARTLEIAVSAGAGVIAALSVITGLLAVLPSTASRDGAQRPQTELRAAA